MSWRAATLPKNENGDKTEGTEEAATLVVVTQLLARAIGCLTNDINVRSNERGPKLSIAVVVILQKGDMK